MKEEKKRNPQRRLLDDIGQICPELQPEVEKLQAPLGGPSYQPGELYSWLVSVTWAVFRIVFHLGRCLLQEVLDEVLQGIDRPEGCGPESRVCPCPTCGSCVWHYNGQKRRAKTFRSIFGDVILRRYQAECSHCHGTFYPLDCILGLPSSLKLFPVLQELVVFLGTRLHFRDAAAALDKALGIRLSADTIRKAVSLAGKSIAALQSHCDWDPELEVVRRGIEEADGPCTVEIALDGAMVPLNKKPKGEANSHQEARSMSLRVKDKNGKVLAKLIVSRLVPLHTFLASVSALVDECRETLALDRIILTGDGAKWIWNFAETCSISRTVLDWYHLRKYITSLFDASGSGKSARRRERLERIEDALWNGRVEEALWELDKYRGRNDQERKARHDLRRYVANNREHIINYHWNWSRAKIVGSGAIEGGQQKSIHDRMKCAGMRWSEEAADRMMAARSAQLNGTATSHLRIANCAA